MLVEKFLWDWLGGLVAVLTALWIASPLLALGASPAYSSHRTWSPRDLCGRAWCRGRTHPRLIPAGPSAK